MIWREIEAENALGQQKAPHRGRCFMQCSTVFAQKLLSCVALGVLLLVSVVTPPYGAPRSVEVILPEETNSRAGENRARPEVKVHFERMPLGVEWAGSLAQTFGLALFWGGPEVGVGATALLWLGHQLDGWPQVVGQRMYLQWVISVAASAALGGFVGKLGGSFLRNRFPRLFRTGSALFWPVVILYGLLASMGRGLVAAGYTEADIQMLQGWATCAYRVGSVLGSVGWSLFWGDAGFFISWLYLCPFAFATSRLLRTKSNPRYLLMLAVLIFGAEVGWLLFAPRFASCFGVVGNAGAGRAAVSASLVKSKLGMAPFGEPHPAFAHVGLWLVVYALGVLVPPSFFLLPALRAVARKRRTVAPHGDSFAEGKNCL